MKDGGYVAKHLNAFNTIVTQLHSMGMKMEEDLCMNFLCSFPDSWDHLVMGISRTATMFKMDGMIASLIFEEIRRKGSKSTKEVLEIHRRSKEKGKKDMKYKSRSKYCGRFKSPS